MSLIKSWFRIAIPQTLAQNRFIPSGLTYFSLFSSSLSPPVALCGGACVVDASQVTVCGARGLENDLAGVWYRAVWLK